MTPTDNTNTLHEDIFRHARCAVRATSRAQKAAKYAEAAMAARGRKEEAAIFREIADKLRKADFHIIGVILGTKTIRKGSKL